MQTVPYYLGDHRSFILFLDNIIKNYIIVHLNSPKRGSRNATTACSPNSAYKNQSHCSQPNLHLETARPARKEALGIDSLPRRRRHLPALRPEPAKVVLAKVGIVGKQGQVRIGRQLPGGLARDHALPDAVVRVLQRLVHDPALGALEQPAVVVLHDDEVGVVVEVQQVAALGPRHGRHGPRDGLVRRAGDEAADLEQGGRADVAPVPVHVLQGGGGDGGRVGRAQGRHGDGLGADGVDAALEHGPVVEADQLRVGARLGGVGPGLDGLEAVEHAGGGLLAVVVQKHGPKVDGAQPRALGRQDDAGLGVRIVHGKVGDGLEQRRVGGGRRVEEVVAAPHGPLLVGLDGEAGDDAVRVAAALEGLEEGRVAVARHVDDGGVGQHQLKGLDRVCCPAVFGRHEAEAAWI